MEEVNTFEKFKKCRATGKLSYPTKMKAKLAILHFKWQALMRKNKVDGTRIKRRMGKVSQRRSYFCEHCQGYHLTKWTKSDYDNYLYNIQKIK